jgi:REP element-mobilizing transposase RayT
MPRPLRLDYAGALFHLTARGVERKAIYLDDSDRLSFLKILSTACERYGCICHAYCLMGNHYHLLLESVEGRLAAAMQEAEAVKTAIHIAFRSTDRSTVDKFYDAAMNAGGRDNGPPGLRPGYHPNYYGAFVLDPDGNNIEAVCHQAP